MAEMKTYKDRADRAAEQKWKTAFIVLQDSEGRVFADASTRNFLDTIEHEATQDDAIYMLSTLLEEFRMDRIVGVVKAELQRASKVGQQLSGPASKILAQGGEEG